MFPWPVHRSLAGHESRKDLLYFKEPSGAVQIHRLLDQQQTERLKPIRLVPLV